MQVRVIERDTNRYLFSIEMNVYLASSVKTGDLISYESNNPEHEDLLGEVFLVEYTRFIFNPDKATDASLVVSRVRGE